MGAKLANSAAETHFYYNAIKEAVAAAIRGSTPIIAVEYGRRSIPHAYRPTFTEMEEKLKSG
jgi:chemotaxis protein MotA